MKTSMWVCLAASITALLTVIIITLVVVMSPNTGGLKNYQDEIINSINTDNIRSFLRNLTQSPHPAGSSRDRDIASQIKEKWIEHGLSDVKLIPYDVYLSHPDPDNPNLFSILDAGSNINYTSSPYQPIVEEHPPSGQESILSFNAFSANGSIEVNRVVYANYGSQDDFEKLNETGVEVTDSIVIIRYSKLFRGDKVRFAEERGALGVILYTDPADAAPLGPNATYPYTVYAPQGSTQLGSLALQGDLRTPGYPATESAYRVPEADIDSPKILVQPVGYQDAFQILKILGGEKAPDDWQGGLDLTYRYGGDLTDRKVKLEVHNKNSQEQVYNVMGTLIGEEEPDRYVLVGNHYDAWTYGGIDPSSATATQLELTRVFGEMYADGWRPRRSILFCSWAAEEPGVIGSTEFAEQFSSVLKDRAVVYLNVDMVMEGNHSFMAGAVPLLYDIIVNTSKIVPNPDPDEVEAGRLFLYDTWVDRYPKNDTDGAEPEPQFYTMGTGSDFRAFLFNLGIPSLDMCFTTAPGELGLPLYHSAYETFNLATLLMDQDMLYHQAIARMWGLLTLEFSTRVVLPFSLKRYSTFAAEEFAILKKEFIGKLLNFGDSKRYLDNAIANLNKTVVSFLDDLYSADWNNDMKLRRYNDAMMLMERSFLSQYGLPDRPLLNHMLLGPSSLNGYVWDVFPGLRDLLRPDNVTLRRNEIREHMAAITHHLNMSASSLTFKLW